MLDFMSIAKLANPETMGKVMEFMNAWLAFMHKTGKKMDDLIAGVERLDNKAQYHADNLDEIKEQLAILISETNLTPQLQENVEAMAGYDPRQGEFIPVEWRKENATRSRDQHQ